MIFPREDYAGTIHSRWVARNGRTVAVLYGPCPRGSWSYESQGHGAVIYGDLQWALDRCRVNLAADGFNPHSLTRKDGAE